MKKTTECPVCRSPFDKPFVELRAIPLNCSALWETRRAAVGAERGNLALSFCPSCGLIFNILFDETLMRYDTKYDNSLHHSPRFDTFARHLAETLVERHGIWNKRVLDIGCGRGDFLRMLCDAGNNAGMGFDPSFDSESASQDPRFAIVQDLYTEAYSDCLADLICCRHVLEHLPSPATLLSGLRRTLQRSPSTVLYFEVPNAQSVFGGPTIWDIHYPHCSYFSAPALTRLFRETHFQVLRCTASFGQQFLGIEAVPGPMRPDRVPNDPAVADLGVMVSSFKRRFRKELNLWSEVIEHSHSSGSRIALWGSGAKGTMFLNVVPGADRVGCVVDMNERKQGKYVPGTGQQIVAPQNLREYKPDAILISNPIYAPEIEAMLHDLGVVAKLVSIAPAEMTMAASGSGM